MAEKRVIQNKAAACHNRWDEISKKITLLQREMDLETRADEKLRLKSVINSIIVERDAIEAEILALDLEDKKLSRQELLQDAIRMERNKAFEEASKRWELILDIAPADQQAKNEISRLQKLTIQYAQINEYTKRLSLRMLEIKSIFARVTRRIQEIGDGSNGTDVSLIALLENFLDEKLDAKEFTVIWEELEAADSSESDSNIPIDFTAFCNRLKRGEIVLFLGSDIPRLEGVDTPDQAMVTDALAKKANYEEFSGSLSMIAEYYQMKPEYGRRELELQLNELLPSGSASIPLYKLLVKIETPMVLISAAYDKLLENIYREAGRKFVVISSLLSANSSFPAGSILIQYSDREYPEIPVIEQELSRNRFLANGYTVIYKIRGSCHPDLEATNSHQDAQQTDLTLSENNYFTFARHADKLIPSYVTKQFIGRGLLFLGYDPKHWEDRLIVNAILEKRQNSSEPSSSIGGSSDRFTSAYWESRNVRQYDIDLKSLVNNLEALL